MPGGQSGEGEDKGDDKANENRISSLEWATFLFQEQPVHREERGQAVDGRTLVFLWCTSVHLENMYTKSCFLERGRIKPQQALCILRNRNVLPSERCAQKCPGFLLEHTYSHICCFLPSHLYKLSLLG